MFSNSAVLGVEFFDNEHSASSPAMSASSGKLPPLLFGKLDCIMTEFEETLNADSPDWEMFHTLLSKESDQDESSWVASLVSTALQMAGEFHRRFVEYLSKFPTRLAWMTFQEPDFPCDVRKATAAYFLACADLDEEFSQKLRIHFMDDFKLCSQTGTISEPLHEMLSVSQLPFEDLKVFEGVSILPRIVYIHKGCLNPRILSWKFRLLLVYVILIVCNLVFLLSFLFVTFTSPDSDCSPARLLLNVTNRQYQDEGCCFLELHLLGNSKKTMSDNVCLNGVVKPTCNPGVLCNPAT